MKKFIAIGVVCTWLVTGFVQPESHAAVPWNDLMITAPSVVLFDASSQRVIYSKTPNLKRAPASTVKILTALVVLDHLDPNQVVTIPEFAQYIQPSKIYLKAGERYRVRDLLRAMLINSANDAAEVLGVAVAGSSPGFGRMMTKKARSIGCRNSNFVRPSGLPADNQYSTAYDMAMIMLAAQKNSFIVDTLRQRALIIKSADGRKIFLKNHNKLLWKKCSREVIGKTGWTRNARHCFVGAISLSDRKVLVAMLGSHKLWRDLRTLVDYKCGSVIRKLGNKEKVSPADDRRKKIQSALRKAGYDPGSIDGRFGSATIRAVKRFQKANGLSPDGVVGTLTLKKLERYL